MAKFTYLARKGSSAGGALLDKRDAGGGLAEWHSAPPTRVNSGETRRDLRTLSVKEMERVENPKEKGKGKGD